MLHEGTKIDSLFSFIQRRPQKTKTKTEHRETRVSFTHSLHIIYPVKISIICACVKKLNVCESCVADVVVVVLKKNERNSQQAVRKQSRHRTLIDFVFLLSS